MVRAFCFLALAFAVDGEYEITLMDGQNISVPGVEASASCSPSSGSCNIQGTSNYHTSNINFNTNTGVFSGTMTTNQCSNNHYGYCALCDPPAYSTHTHQASCITVTFPSQSGPAAAPLRGPVGYTVTGVNIYGPEEAGFGTGRFPKPCKDGSGTCPAGMDVPTCETKLDFDCAQSGSTPVHELMLDTCGGHAMPYHYHNDNACDYDHTASGHSPLVGFGLDGVGIYGLYENNPSKPSSLDACNGHVGSVPSDGTFGVPSGTSMYHYHVTSSAPYTLGCFGESGKSPATISQDKCKSLYSTCNTGYSEVELTTGEKYCYDTDCPCFDGRTSRLGRNTDVTSCLNSFSV